MMVNQVALIRDKPKIPENSNASNRLDIVPAPINNITNNRVNENFHKPNNENQSGNHCNELVGLCFWNAGKHGRGNIDHKVGPEGNINR